MTRQLLHILFLLVSCSSIGQLHPTKDLLKAHRNEILYNLDYLVKDSVLNQQIVLSTENVTINSSQDSTSISTHLYSDINHPTPFSPNGYGKPLTGLKVAIDPGHTAYSFESAQIEGKFVSITEGKNTCEIYESQNTWLVAMTLKSLLENQGAEVLNTRPTIKSDSKGKSFPYWLTHRAKIEIDSLYSNNLIDSLRYQYLNECLKDTSSRKNKKSLFKYAYNIIDIENRAQIINNFEPHVTIIIHFNVDVNNTGWTKPTAQNYNMVFTPGAFMTRELKGLEDVTYFKDLLFSARIRKSHILGALTLKHLNASLQVAPLIDDQQIEYLSLYSLKSSYYGVYSRNLSLTRKIKSPLCYGESVYQDHWDSCSSLAKQDINFEGYLINQTIYKIASGYFRGIKEYLEYEFE